MVELTDPADGDAAGVLRRIAPWGGIRWSAAGREGDPFVDARLHGDEVLATSRDGLLCRIGLDDGTIRAVDPGP